VWLFLHFHFSIFYQFHFFQIFAFLGISAKAKLSRLVGSSSCLISTKWKSSGTCWDGPWLRYSTVVGIPSSASTSSFGRNLFPFGSSLNCKRVDAYGSLVLADSVLVSRNSSDSWASMMASLPSAPFLSRLVAVAVAVATNPGIGTGWLQYPLLI
jgi:hypothetical protein